MTDPREAGQFWLEVPAKLDDPWPDLAWLREHRPALAHDGQVFVFRHADVEAVFHDEERFTADRLSGLVYAVPEDQRDAVHRLEPFLHAWVMMLDAPAHTRTRQLLHAAFNPHAVTRLASAMATVTGELLDRAADAGRIDVAADLALPMPAWVLSDFLGFDPSLREQVERWSVDCVDFFNIVPITSDTTRRFTSSASEMIAALREVADARRAHPREDFVSLLLAAEHHGERLADDEILANAVLFLLAGHVPVRNLLGNTVWLLGTHPDERAKLAADPSLLGAAIEESVRFETPTTMIPRVATTDLEIHGVPVARGQVVQLVLAAANRDPRVFDEPDVFRIDRPAHRVASYGFGLHACLGAGMVRQEVRIALSELYARFPDLRLDPDAPPTWYRNAVNRGPITLPCLTS